VNFLNGSCKLNPMLKEDRKWIIVNPDLLSEDSIPSGILGRGPQIAQLQFCLAPALKGQRPLHCMVYGTPGTGKTATVKYFLSNLEHESGIRGVYVNCWEHNSFYATLDKIVVDLRILRAEKLNTSFKLERFQSFIGDRPFLIILDEIDQLSPKERNSALYNLCNVRNLGLIVICNNKHTLFTFDERVRSRFQPTQIAFEPYSAEDLVCILTRRAEHALHPQSWDRAVLEKISGLSEGDARIAIQTLRNASHHAEAQYKTCIDHLDVLRGWNSVKGLKKSYLLKTLTEHHRLLYEITRKQKQILSGTLWSLYLRECKKKKIKPMAVRTYSLYTNKLIELGLIKAERALVRGKVRLLKVG
jgi:cell division control protein 6